MDLIVTVKLDRWARSLVHLVQSMDELTRLGVARFVVTSQGIDTDRSNPMTELTINLLEEFRRVREVTYRRANLCGVTKCTGEGRGVG